MSYELPSQDIQIRSPNSNFDQATFHHHRLVDLKVWRDKGIRKNHGRERGGKKGENYRLIARCKTWGEEGGGSSKPIVGTANNRQNRVYTDEIERTWSLDGCDFEDDGHRNYLFYRLRFKDH
ncbi:unnamed protein product [Lactuca saligna]|uniref:Uncharacterized protein n=1 Tax=Lactuca saligna TaxID=75948 RepID=A0AA35YNP9_LACSI|nr:unnamed protein product [Lactuca saligna]